MIRSSAKTTGMCVMLVALVAIAPMTVAMSDVAFAQTIVPKKTKKKVTTTPKKKRKKRRKKKKDKDKTPPPVEAAPPPAEPPPPPEKTPEELRIEAETARVEAAKAKREAEGRKKSALAAGMPSRWSNRGAMIPVVAEVPITAPIPARNIRLSAGVATPGQKLFEGDEVFSARLAFSGYRLSTAGQEIRFLADDQLATDRDIELLRGRATLAYERVAGSEFGVHLDLEYRPTLNDTRFADQRVNELYVSYGLTDFRGGGSTMSFGLALGRLAIREAGYAQADGISFRLRVIDELDVGAFGGITGNPYGYNWNLKTSEFISAGWYTGGVFSAIRVGPFSANVAGVMTYANPNVLTTGLDRLYVSLDASYVVNKDLNFFVTGIVDLLPSGQLIQNLDLSGAYSVTEDISLSASVGRFSTVYYEQSTGYSYQFDPLGNRYNQQLNNQRIVDDNGNPIVPFDAAFYSTVYNQLRVRGGYRVIREVEIFGAVNALLRDYSATEAALAADADIQVKLDATPLRVLPTAGVRYRDPKILDASFDATAVIDARSNTKAIVSVGVGRGLFGLYASVDGRYFLGDINGLDGGANLSYTFPRDWFPGLLLIRATARYFRENVALLRPVDDLPENNVLVPKQETVLLFGGIEWRL